MNQFNEPELAKKIIVFINKNFAQSAEARIFNNIYLSMARMGAEISIRESHVGLAENSECCITIGFSSDVHYKKTCESSNNINLLSVCDIYSVEGFIRDDIIYSGYIVPSDEHKNLLKYITNKPIFVIEELVDPLFQCDKEDRVQGEDVNVCWFGFPESFNKSMTVYVNTIEDVLSGNFIDKFAIITRPGQNLNKLNSFEILNFDINKIRQQMNVFDYCILSHAPLDLHINTLIKSPNKLYSAIMLGVIPVCTNTPAYEKIMRKLGLSEYLYDTPDSLNRILRKLRCNHVRDRARIGEIQQKLEEYLTQVNHKNCNVLDMLSRHQFLRSDLKVSSRHLDNIGQTEGIRGAVTNLLKAIRNRIHIYKGTFG